VVVLDGAVAETDVSVASLVVCFDDSTLMVDCDVVFELVVSMVELDDG
jgi:hypothetical protein